MPDNRSGQDNLAITDFQSSTYGFHESRPFFECFGRRVEKMQAGAESIWSGSRVADHVPCGRIWLHRACLTGFRTKPYNSGKGTEVSCPPLLSPRAAGETSMFDNLQDKLQRVFKNLRGEGKLTEKNIQDALREIRMALLEADVNFRVVKQLIEGIRNEKIQKIPCVFKM